MSESSSASVRADIQQKYSDLFGTKTIGGRTVNVEELIARMTRATRSDVASLMQARHQLHNRVAHRQGQYDFLDPSTQITDPDGNRATVGDIRQGMLDGFFGRKTPKAWRVGATVPLPTDTMTPGLEGTGPSIDLGMAHPFLGVGAGQCQRARPEFSECAAARDSSRVGKIVATVERQGAAVDDRVLPMKARPT